MPPEGRAEKARAQSAPPEERSFTAQEEDEEGSGGARGRGARAEGAQGGGARGQGAGGREGAAEEERERRAKQAQEEESRRQRERERPKVLPRHGVTEAWPSRVLPEQKRAGVTVAWPSKVLSTARVLPSAGVTRAATTTEQAWYGVEPIWEAGGYGASK